MEYIMERFRRNVQTGPDTPFLYDDAHPGGVTFAQFDDMSARVYGWLKKRGVGRENFVLIHLPRGLMPFVAAAGVWKAGAAFVIAEESYTPERAALIREDCGCVTVIDRDALGEILLGEPKAGWETPDPHDAAFAVYTSGTTGRPKGALHEYGNIDRCLRSMELEGDPMLGSGIFRPYTSPLTFVAAVIGLTAMLAADHARMYIVSYATAKNPEKLVALYEKYGFNMAFFSPSYARVLVPLLKPYLKTLVVASEPAGDLFFPGIRMLNFYGGSESYFLAAVFQFDRPRETAPVGKPAFPLDLRLLDENGEEVTKGETGEVTYDNPFFRGYINLPEETAAVLRNGRFFSGDLGRTDEDGNLVILGRVGDMVKINGNRVEPGEIENVAKKVLGIDWAAARVFTTETNSVMICLYYTADIAFDPETVRRRMAEYLPYYMIPARFMRIEHVPLRPSGKLERKALPAPDQNAGRSAYKAPADETETALCRAFERVLALESVGTADDFYALGGDSLHAIRTVTESGLPGLDAGMIFRGRTPEKIAKIYLAEYSENEAESREARNLNALGKAHPLTTEQVFMLDVQLYTPKSTMYNLAYLLRAAGETDAERLARAAGEAIRAHPSLLTVLQFSEDGEPQQRYCPERFEEILPEQISEKELSELKDTLVQPFRIIGERLYRCRVFQTEKSVYLFLDIHHIIFDGTSLRILMKDLDLLYDGGEAGPDWYGLLLEEREKERRGAFYRESREYFEQTYGGTAWSNHPATDHAVRDNRADEIILPLRIGAELLEQAEKAYHVSRNELMIAAALTTIGLYNGENDILISWIYHGRNNPLYGNTTGLLFRDLPAAVHLDRLPGFGDLLAEVRRQVQGGMEHDCYPYTEAGFSGLREMNACLLYQRHLYDAVFIGGTQMEPVELRQNQDASQTSLDIEILDEPEGLSVLLDYAASLYDRSSILRFGEMLEDTLRAVTEPDPKRRDELRQSLRKRAGRMSRERGAAPLDLRKVSPELKEYDRIRTLYEAAFPENERIDWDTLERVTGLDGVDFRACYDGDLFTGFWVASVTEEAVFLLYLAVPEELRSEGYGSRMLDAFRKTYSGRVFFLNTEPADEEAENAEQREKRLSFYRRNGFEETGYQLLDQGDRYSILSSERPFRKEAYQEAVNQLSGGRHPAVVVKERTESACRIRTEQERK